MYYNSFAYYCVKVIISFNKKGWIQVYTPVRLLVHRLNNWWALVVNLRSYNAYIIIITENLSSSFDGLLYSLVVVVGNGFCVLLKYYWCFLVVVVVMWNYSVQYYRHTWHHSRRILLFYDGYNIILKTKKLLDGNTVLFSV